MGPASPLALEQRFLHQRLQSSHSPRVACVWTFLHGSFHRLPFEFSSIGRIRILAELGLEEIKTAGFEDLFYHRRTPKCPIKAGLTLFLITCINQTVNVLYPSGNRNAAATTAEPGHQPPSPGWEHLKGGALSCLPSIEYSG